MQNAAQSIVNGIRGQTGRHVNTKMENVETEFQHEQEPLVSMQHAKGSNVQGRIKKPKNVTVVVRGIVNGNLGVIGLNVGTRKVHVEKEFQDVLEPIQTLHHVEGLNVKEIRSKPKIASNVVYRTASGTNGLTGRNVILKMANVGKEKQ